MPDLLETLASYVPALIARRLAANPAPITAPTVERFPAAVLFADVTGFTALTERLAQRGPQGVEELTGVLKDYFEPLVALIYEHGGDVMKFAGDALLAIWPVEDPRQGADRAAAGLATAAGWAAQCGLAIQERLRNYRASDGTLLFLRIGVAAGEVVTMHIGGMYKRWEFVVAGEPLVQVNYAENHAQPGQVVLAREAWALIQNYCVGHPAGNGGAQIESFHSPLPPHRGPPPKPQLSSAATAPLKAYIPGAILYRLEAGLSGWLAELRRVTVIFVNLPDWDHTTTLDQAQAVMHGLQEAVYYYEGSINKLNVDDKGITLVAALGLPPLAHENDAARGVLAGLKIKETLDGLGWRSGIGVVTGQTFCGAVGSRLRREYTMLGDVVNLAARLMQAAPGSILCETATHQAAQSDIDFETLAPITVKGKAEPIQIYRPLAQKKTALRAGARTEMVGRGAERRLLAAQLQALHRDNQGNTLVIEGEAGIGKSRLVDDLRRQAEAMRLTVFFGAGDAVERGLYYAWRRIISQLLDLEILTGAEARRQHVLNLLEDDPELVRLAPLLSDLQMDLDISDNELTAQMSPQVRADNRRDLLLRLLQASATRSPKIIILEDAHWMDSASWELALLVHSGQRTRSAPLLFVLVTRSLAEQRLREAYTQIINAPHTRRLPLDALSPEEALTLVARHLGVSSLPAPVAALIQDKAQGNPFFSEELAHALHDTGLIRVVDGECLIAPEAGDLRSVNLPDTVQGVITSRIDRLSPSQQLALKVASVIGREFALRTLADIYPIESERALLPDYLAKLRHLDLTPLDTPEPEPAYVFKHTITQEVAYNLMLFSQRRELHRAVAEWYERVEAQDLSKYYPLLAHHWSKALDAQRAETKLVLKTIDYFEKSGEQAMRNYANQEAIGFFTEALALAEGYASRPASPARDVQLSPLRRARWERQLGEAYLNLGHLAESRKHFQVAAAALKQSVPGTRGGLITSLAGQVLLQALRRLSPVAYNSGPPAAPSRSAELLEAARTYGGLAQIYFYGNEMTRNIHANLRSLNLAEAAGHQPAELARSYANVSVAAGLIPLHAAAEAYSRRARETVQGIAKHPSGIEQISHHHPWVYLLTAVYSAGVGKWDQAGEASQQAADIADRLGDRRRWEQSINTLATVKYLQGEFTQSAELFKELYAVAHRQGDVQYQAYGLIGQMRCRLTLGQMEQMAADLGEVHALLARTRSVGRVEEIMAHGVIALAYLRQAADPRQGGDAARALARQAAEKVMLLIGYSRPISYNLVHAYAAAPEVYLTLWEQSPLIADGHFVAGARHALETLRRFARIFPIGQPRAWLWRGKYEQLGGSPSEAEAAWEKSLAAAEKLGMPYEQGLTHLAFGQHTTGDERQRHRAEALEIFTRLGAAYDAEQAAKILRKHMGEQP